MDVEDTTGAGCRETTRWRALFHALPEEIQQTPLGQASTADSLCRRRNAAAIRRPQRVIAQRVARAYRTVSFAAACVLAGTPPWELEAWVLARVYDWKAAQRALDRHLDPIEREEVREEAREIITGHWA
ncbi:uncharacterized protein LOC135117500 [Helicoverpa armigera]|uniref:uncharacterized protein LOC135117500 n=1 Tax=Helicoverpa armigera TaxID=29058 RepID=UPI0030826EE1